jgi:hypothetical protein
MRTLLCSGQGEVHAKLRTAAAQAWAVPGIATQRSSAPRLRIQGAPVLYVSDTKQGIRLNHSASSANQHSTLPLVQSTPPDMKSFAEPYASVESGIRLGRPARPSQCCRVSQHQSSRHASPTCIAILCQCLGHMTKCQHKDQSSSIHMQQAQHPQSWHCPPKRLYTVKCHCWVGKIPAY